MKPTTPQQARELLDDYEATWRNNPDIDSAAFGRLNNALRSLADQVEALTAERDALMKDAERYRELCAKSIWTITSVPGVLKYTGRVVLDAGQFLGIDDLDDLLDAAIAKGAAT